MVKKRTFLPVIVERLLSPAVPIGDPVLLHKIKLLAAMLLVFISGSFLYSLLHLLLDAGFVLTFYWLNLTNVILAVGYGLNRRGYYRWAASLTVVVLSISILISMLLTRGNVRYFYVMIMPVLLGSMLLSLRGTLLLAASDLVGLVVTAALSPRIQISLVEAAPAVVFFTTLSILLLVSVQSRDRLERERQTELINNESLYRSLVENFNEIIYKMDKEGCFTYLSPYTELITGYKVEDLLGRHFSPFIFPEDLAAVETNFKKALSGAGEPIEFRIISKNKKILHLRNYTQLLEENHRPLGVIGVFSDITGQKILHDQLHQAQKMESVGRLAGGVAHDFNNILTVIIGYCEMLAEDEKANPDTLTMVKNIKAAAERAISLTRQLLIFSRKHIFQPTRLNMNDLIKNLEKMLHRLIGEHITLKTHLAAEIHDIKTDAAQMEQVIMNLAVNARDAMPQGGTLIIETSAVYLDESYRRKYSEVIPGDYVILAISDTGCGMDEKTRKNIFEPFFTTKEAGKGTGLGLSTVYSIVKQCGGHINFYSEVNLGTTFKIYFPAVNREMAQDKAKKIKSMDLNILEGNELLLVVEDQEDLREMIVESLRLYGYRVQAAQNGMEALELCQRHSSPDQSFALLITDVVMPKMNGKELADKIVLQYPGIKILYISGYTEQAIVEHNILLKGLAFLPKPFSPALLAEKVRHLLDHK
jgi:two-component system cell cycle sensor histidine kinase/response regulator CckA